MLILRPNKESKPDSIRTEAVGKGIGAKVIGPPISWVAPPCPMASDMPPESMLRTLLPEPMVNVAPGDTLIYGEVLLPTPAKKELVLIDTAEPIDIAPWRELISTAGAAICSLSRNKAPSAKIVIFESEKMLPSERVKLPEHDNNAVSCNDEE